MRNGDAPKNEPGVTWAQHEDLKAYVMRRFDEQAELLKFIEQQAKLTGQAMELLLASQGLDMPEDS